MPIVQTKGSTNSPARPLVMERQPAEGSAELIRTILEYETVARKKGIDLSTGRFSMLTASEREFLHAELVADYIRLSAGNMGNTPGYFDSTLHEFCGKVCDMQVTSHELIGTYLAAVDVVTSSERLSQVSGLLGSVRNTMIAVLQGCVELLGKRMEAGVTE